ncbi:uncharacterized protein Dana_GF24513, isoform B [Drosophila ananassae]|uniref:Uncharacterized protein, isoform B n=1 Tax=Drosophila ananassae TaxID=7217 RepID=A0A0P9C2Y2_DROAN|nr:protein transport protein SEC31 isoform X2 [Drosophila ananassae]XP_044570975.1 protein transport protein SEC31 isoform X2 [Drosophila ananassae]KPU78032.1 uncharacterized protein Dana_GF24513, isoform B [Drosophila ananassae]
MSNQAQIDYDKQFQDDLAKATALSLEQQALDDYRRHKKYGTGYRPSSSTATPAAASAREYHVAQRSQSVNQGRRHSEVHPTLAAPVSLERSRTPPAQGTDNDLICFASPTSKQPENDSPFGRLIEDLQRIQTTNPQSAMVPVGPVAAASVPAPYGFVPPSPHVQPPPYGMVGAPAGGMQLVPYQAPGAQQQRPLNNEELQRLYSLPAQMAQMQVVPVAQPNTIYYYPGAVVTPPVVPGSAAYMPPQYPAQSYRYGGGFTHMDLSQPRPSPAPSVSSQPSSHVAPPQNSQNPANGVALKARRQVPSTASISSSSNGQRSGSDLIDLNQDEYSRVSVLEAFDPLLNENTVSKK